MTDPAIEPPPRPYAELWAALDEAKTQISRLENELNELRYRVNGHTLRLHDLEAQGQRENLE